MISSSDLRDDLNWLIKLDAELVQEMLTTEYVVKDASVLQKLKDHPSIRVREGNAITMLGVLQMFAARDGKKLVAHYEKVEDNDPPYRLVKMSSELPETDLEVLDSDMTRTG